MLLPKSFMSKKVVGAPTRSNTFMCYLRIPTRINSCRHCLKRKLWAPLRIDKLEKHHVRTDIAHHINYLQYPAFPLIFISNLKINDFCCLIILHVHIKKLLLSISLSYKNVHLHFMCSPLLEYYLIHKNYTRVKVI